MPSKRLMGAFAFVDICLLAAGVILIVFSELWRMPNLMLNFTFSNEMLTGTFSIRPKPTVLPSGKPN